MNGFGLVQLIWIKRLVSETSRINTLIECNKLSVDDLNRYKAVISSIDDFCAFVINSQNWRDIKNVSKIVEEVEMVLFQHFYEQMDAFEGEEVHLDFSNGENDEVNLRFENPLIEDMSFAVIDDETYNSIHKNSGNIPDESINIQHDLKDFDFEKMENSFNGPILEGTIISDDDLDIGGYIDPMKIFNPKKESNPIEELFNMADGDCIEISLGDFINLISQNQEELSFTLNPEVCGDEYSEDEEVSLEEFVANLLDDNNKKPLRFGLIDDEDIFD